MSSSPSSFPAFWNPSFIVLPVLALSGLLACTPPAQPNGQRPPNVVLILTDDQGYGDIGYHGNPHIQTPFLDSLAKAGHRFDQFYVSPRCAPTRAALMTGRYPEKTGVFHVTDGGHIMAQEAHTMAEYFRDAGYATGMMGKWHIGDHYPYLPNDQGFEQAVYHGGGAVGQLSDHPDNYWDMTLPLEDRKSCYFDPTLYRNRQPFQAEGYITDVLTEEAMAFVDQTGDQSFFLYLAYNAPHDPFQVPQAYLDRYRDLPPEVAPDTRNGSTHRLSDDEAARYVYAMMTNLDDNLRRLVQRLTQAGKWENTLLVFLSDNGPAAYRYTGGLRGKKGSVYEGGIRVPAFLHAPMLGGGQRHALPTAHIDLLPTLARLCGVPLSMPVDGLDLSPLLRGQALPTDRYLVSRESNPMEPYRDLMLRQGDWKLVSSVQGGTPRFELYNLAEDPAEARDRAAEQPKRVAALRAHLDAWYREVSHADQLAIHPIFVGSELENPVRISRHELVKSYASGWFSPHYLGYAPIFITQAGRYDLRLTFREPLQQAGVLSFKLGPVGRRLQLEGPQREHVFRDVWLPRGEYPLQAWFQHQATVVSPFYLELHRTDFP